MSSFELIQIDPTVKWYVPDVNLGLLTAIKKAQPPSLKYRICPDVFSIIAYLLK